MDGRISNFAQVASLRRYTLTEGAEKGLEVIDCDNGRLRFLLNVSKALDVMQMYDRGVNLSFLSKNGFTARELPFLRRFEGGMLYTCGLDAIGGMDGHELHGNLHSTPARVLRATCDEEGITVEAEVALTSLFGENLVLNRRFFSPIGENTLYLEDTLVNRGYREEDYCLLYHVNLGYPLLDTGTRILADVAECRPRTPWSAACASEAFTVTEPVPCQEENCYFLRLEEPIVTVANERMGRAFTLVYEPTALPCFTLWKSMASGDYAVGLEPCTCELDGGFAYKKIPAGGEVKFYLSMRSEDR